MYQALLKKRAKQTKRSKDLFRLFCALFQKRFKAFATIEIDGLTVYERLFIMSCFERYVRLSD
jgi:hypothetical protein